MHYHPSILLPDLLLEAFHWRHFSIFLGCHTQLESLMAFMNTVSPKIKYIFTYSKQTVWFSNMQVYLSESRKLKTKLYRKPTDCRRYFTFTSTTHLAEKNLSFIHKRFDTTWLSPNTTSFRKNFNNLTRILLAWAYPLHVIIKNIKKTLIYTGSNLLSQWIPHTGTNIFPIITPF